MSLAVTLSLAVLVVVWAAAFPLIAIGLEGFAPTHLTLVRHVVASLTFVVLLTVFRQRPWPAWRDWPALAGLGVVGIFVYHWGLNTGQQHVSAGATSLIIATAPVLTATFATVLGRDRLPPLGWAGSLLGLVGVACIVMGDALARGEVASLVLRPSAGLILLAAACTALFSVLQQPYLSRYRPLELMAYVTWAATAAMVGFVPGVGEAVVAAWPRATLAAVALGVLPSAIGYTLFAMALARAPATLVTTYLYFIPFLALLLSWWWLGEVPTVLTLVGGIVVIAAVVLVRHAKRRAPRAPAAAPAD